MISFNDSCFDELLFEGAPELCWGNKGAGDIMPANIHLSKEYYQGLLLSPPIMEPMDGFGWANEDGDMRLSNADRSGLLCVGFGCVIPKSEGLNEEEAAAKFPKPCDDCWANPPTKPVLGLFQVGVFDIVLLVFQFICPELGLKVPEELLVLGTDIAFMDMDLLIRESVKLTGEADTLGGWTGSCFCIICFFSCNVKLEEDFGMLGVFVLFSCFTLSVPMTVLTRLLLSLLM